MKLNKLITEAEDKLKIALDAFLAAQRKCKEKGEIADELESCHDHILKAAQHAMNAKAITSDD